MRQMLYTVDLGILGEVDLEVSYDYRPARHGVAYLRNGDPGSPPEPEELEILAVSPDFTNDLIADFLASSNEFYVSVLDSLAEEKASRQEELWEMKREERLYDKAA